MRYLLLLILLTNILNPILGCTCEGIDSLNILDLINQADFVVEGEYLTNLNPNAELRNSRNKLEFGYDVLFKVSKVIKGILTSDTIALIQLDNGSCSEKFRQGEKYIILGARINGFLCNDENKLPLIPKDHNGIESIEIFLSVNTVDEQGIMNYYYCDDQETQYWNSVAKKYTTSYVSYCTAFHASSKSGRLIREYSRIAKTSSREFGIIDSLLNSIDRLNIERLDMPDALNTLRYLENKLTASKDYETILYVFHNRSQLAHEGQVFWVFGVNDNEAEYIYSYLGTDSFERREIKKQEFLKLKKLISNYTPRESYLQEYYIPNDYQMFVMYKSKSTETGIFTTFKFEPATIPEYPSEAFVELANYLWIYL